MQFNTFLISIYNISIHLNHVDLDTTMTIVDHTHAALPMTRRLTRSRQPNRVQPTTAEQAHKQAYMVDLICYESASFELQPDTGKTQTELDTFNEDTSKAWDNYALANPMLIDIYYHGIKLQSCVCTWHNKLMTKICISNSQVKLYSTREQDI